MEGKTLLRRIIQAVLVFIFLVGLVMSTDQYPLVISKGVQFNYEDSVRGYGYFGSYDNIAIQGPHADSRIQNRLADVDLQKMDHGSGSIEHEAIIKSNTSNLTQNLDPYDTIYVYALIAALDNSSMVYNPQTMSIGNGYYSTHPVKFNSLLGDKTRIKNYASETSMVQETKHAKGINKDLAAGVEDDYSGWDPSNGLARSLMNLNEGVNSGTAHIAMLQGNKPSIGSSEFGKSAWHNPNVTIDEVYTGTFDLGIKMNLTMPVYKTELDEDWLPCSCAKGWDDMNLHDQRYHSAKGFFDCTTCLKGPAKVQCTKEG